METRETVAEKRAKHWAEIVRECGDSGVSVKAYCERNGLSENRYYYWRRKLRDADEQQGNQGGAVAAGFTEVRLVDASETMTSSEIRVEIGAYKLSADSTYPTEMLATLLRELARSC